MTKGWARRAWRDGHTPRSLVTLDPSSHKERPTPTGSGSQVTDGPESGPEAQSNSTGFAIRRFGLLDADAGGSTPAPVSADVEMNSPCSRIRVSRSS